MPVSCLIEGRGLVLVVDDERVVRDMVQNMLKWLGYEVAGAGDGSEAVEIFRAHKEEISIILLDLSMPGMNGLADPDGLKIFATGYSRGPCQRMRRSGSYERQPSGPSVSFR